MNLQKAMLGIMVAVSFGAIAYAKQAEVDFILNLGPARADSTQLLALERPSSRLGSP